MSSDAETDTEKTERKFMSFDTTYAGIHVSDRITFRARDSHVPKVCLPRSICALKCSIEIDAVAGPCPWSAASSSLRVLTRLVLTGKIGRPPSCTSCTHLEIAQVD